MGWRSRSRRAIRRSSSSMRSHSGSGRRSTVSLLWLVKATTWPGTPTTVALGGTLETTTAPAPMREPWPIVTSPMIFAPAPTTTPSSRVGWRFSRRVEVPPRVTP